VRNGLVGHVVQAALGVDIVQIHSRRKLLVDERQHGDACLQASRAAQQMPSHRLGARDLEIAAQSVLAKDRFDRLRLVSVAGGVAVAWAFT